MKTEEISIKVDHSFKGVIQVAYDRLLGVPLLGGSLFPAPEHSLLKYARLGQLV